MTPDDVKALAVPVLAHRLLLSTQSRLQGETPDLVIERALASAEVPVEDVGSTVS